MILPPFSLPEGNDMITAKREYAEKRMQQKWYELVIAEQQGASTKVLERKYHSYMLALEEYNRYASANQQDYALDSRPVKRKKSA